MSPSTSSCFSSTLYKSIRPFIFRMFPDAEDAHRAVSYLCSTLGGSGLARYVLGTVYGFEDDRLVTDVAGVRMANPVGLAAGYDKNGEMLDFLGALGFGHIEIGSVTAEPRSGNQRPRMWRLAEDEAAVNRMGLNNKGAEAVQDALMEWSTRLLGGRRPVLGVNIAKTHDPEITGDRGIEDFASSFSTLYQEGDYITLNISCPNTAEGKTFEDPVQLEKLLTRLNKAEEEMLNGGSRKSTIFLKLSPDIDEKMLEEMLFVAKFYGIDGYVCGNTSSKRGGIPGYWMTVAGERKLEKIGKGGLSGRPVRNLSTELVGNVYRLTEGKKPIIGCGGVFDAEDAWDKITAGASAVQLLTGMVYEGPGIAKSIKRGLIRKLDEYGLKGIKDAVGRDAWKLKDDKKLVF